MSQWCLSLLYAPAPPPTPHPLNPTPIPSRSQMLLAWQSSPDGSEAMPTSSDYPPEPPFTTFTLQTNQTTSWPPPPPNHHSPLPWTPTPPTHLIRSSSVARHHGLFLHPTDTWQTNECSFVWRDPPQIAPKMHHTGICLFFCIFNECMCVSRLSVLFWWREIREPLLFLQQHTSECELTASGRVPACKD